LSFTGCFWNIPHPCVRAYTFSVRTSALRATFRAFGRCRSALPLHIISRLTIYQFPIVMLAYICHHKSRRLRLPLCLSPFPLLYLPHATYVRTPAPRVDSLIINSSTPVPGVDAMVGVQCAPRTPPTKFFRSRDPLAASLRPRYSLFVPLTPQTVRALGTGWHMNLNSAILPQLGL